MWCVVCVCVFVRVLVCVCVCVCMLVLVCVCVVYRRGMEASCTRRAVIKSSQVKASSDRSELLASLAQVKSVKEGATMLVS